MTDSIVVHLDDRYMSKEDLDDRYMSRVELNNTYMNQDNSLKIKIGTPEEDSTEIEGIDLYTFNGTEEKIISILEGSNIEFSKENGVITISTTQEPLKGGQNITIGSDNSINANNMKTSYYGECSTNGNTPQKEINNVEDFELKKGVIIGIKFTNTNTADYVTLNVNGTGDKSIGYNGGIYASNSPNICGKQNILNYYLYDGTCWVYLGRNNFDITIDQLYQRKLEAGNFITINEETNTINADLSDYYNKTQIDEEYYTKDQVETFVNEAINTALKNIFTGKIGDIEYVDGQIIAEMYESNDDTILS